MHSRILKFPPSPYRLFSLIVLLLATLVVIQVCPATAQQTDVSRYTLYAGFGDLNSPALGLNQTGFHTQFGVNMRRWYALGADYSVNAGQSVLTPGLLPQNLQQEFGQVILALIQQGIIPPTYQLRIPANVFTQSIAIGPQFEYRHFRRVTIFARPSFGAFRLGATPRPQDPVAAQVAAALVPSGHKVDWTGFYGFGVGDDIRLTRLLWIRTQMDAVYNHPFNDILANGFWTYRTSAGLDFHFGRNILAPHAK